MRISTQHIFNLADVSMANANQAIFKTQEEISSGQRIQSAADDPVAAIRINNLTNYLDTIEQYEKNITAAENNLELEETTLSSINNILQRIEELAVSAGNIAVLSPAEYGAIASEIASRTDELVGLMNTQNSNGTHIFAGFKGDTPAFSGDFINGFNFDGDEGQRSVRIDDNTFIETSDSGKSLFVDVPSNNNTARASIPSSNRSSPPLEVSAPMVVDQDAYDAFYPEDMVIKFNEDSALTPAARNFTITERSTGKVLLNEEPYIPGADITVEGVSFRISGNPVASDAGMNNGDQLFIDSSNTQDILTTVQKFYNVLQDYDGSADARDELEAIVGDTIVNISNAQESINETITSIGARNNTLESIRDLHTDADLITREVLSELRDTDFAEAATRLSAQTLILQATQASFLTISELSLINQL